MDDDAREQDCGKRPLLETRLGGVNVVDKHASANQIALALSSPPTADGRVEAVLVQIKPLPSLKQLEPVWRDLERRAEASFFLSWDWIGVWLAESSAQPNLLVAFRGDLVVGLGLIGEDCLSFGPIRLRRIHVNQTGLSEYDCTYIEYNDLLLDRTFAATIRGACLAELIAWSSWQEMDWPAAPIPIQQMPTHPHLVIEQRKTSLSPYVDLDAVRNSGNELCSLVNGRVRREISTGYPALPGNGRAAYRTCTHKEGCSQVAPIVAGLAPSQLDCTRPTRSFRATVLRKVSPSAN